MGPVLVSKRIEKREIWHTMNCFYYFTGGFFNVAWLQGQKHKKMSWITSKLILALG